MIALNIFDIFLKNPFIIFPNTPNDLIQSVVNIPVKKLEKLVNIEVTALHTLFTPLRNHSHLLYKVTNTPAKVKSIVITNPIGFIRIARFKAFCAIVIALVAAVTAI